MHSWSSGTNAMLTVSMLLSHFWLDAVSKADGRRIEGKKIIVDRELGRTRKDWLPRRLGGGKGDSRRDRNDEDVLRRLKWELDQEERQARRLEKEQA
jgi:hypothetical protein